MKTYCNPLDLPYRYQHMNEQGRRYAFREGADPTLVYFKGTYYLFVSMSAGFFYSDNLLDWRFHADPDLMIYDYAPDVRQVGDYLYFCASSRSKDCPILRSADPLHEKFEQVAAPFPFWDPDLFLDNDGRLYFYWGCTNTEPIWGVELDRETLQPIGEKRPLIAGDPEHLGYERPGENGEVDRESSVVYRSLAPLFNSETGKIEMPAATLARSGMTNEALTKIFLAVGQPYLEGAYMTKHGGKYYLQYACPRHPVQHLRRRRLCGAKPARALHPAGVQPLLGCDRRVHHRRGARQHGCRQTRQFLARRHHAHFGQP